MRNKNLAFSHFFEKKNAFNEHDRFLTMLKLHTHTHTLIHFKENFKHRDVPLQ